MLTGAQVAKKIHLSFSSNVKYVVYSVIIDHFKWKSNILFYRVEIDILV